MVVARDEDEEEAGDWATVDGAAEWRVMFSRPGPPFDFRIEEWQTARQNARTPETKHKRKIIAINSFSLRIYFKGPT